MWNSLHIYRTSLQSLIFLLLFHSAAAMCLHGTIQLVDGANEREGHVEICIEGVWGLVSDLQWEYEDAAVVCRSLGYEPLGKSDI